MWPSGAARGRLGGAGLKHGLRRGQAPGAPQAGVQRQGDRPFAEGGGGGESGPGLGPGGRPFQFERNVFVGADGGVGPVPGPAVGIGSRIGGLGEGPVHRPSVAGHGGVVDRGAHQWVAEADPDAEVDQFRRLGRGGCLGADAQLTSGPPEQTHSPTGSAAAISNNSRVSRGSDSTRRR